MLTFFIVDLLYLLCFEHVDNSGAYPSPEARCHAKLKAEIY